MQKSGAKLPATERLLKGTGWLPDALRATEPAGEGADIAGTAGHGIDADDIDLAPDADRRHAAE